MLPLEMIGMTEASATPEPIDAAHLEARIEHRHVVIAHFARADGMEGRHGVGAQPGEKFGVGRSRRPPARVPGRDRN